MEYSQTRLQDLKLLFDTLANSDGHVDVEKVCSVWPGSGGPGSLPPDVPSSWRKESGGSDKINWRGFRRGVEKSLLAHAASHGNKEWSRSADEGWVVNCSEMEKFLGQCPAERVGQALILSRREVYKCHKSLGELSRAAHKAEAAQTPDKPHHHKATTKRSASFAGVRTSHLVVAPGVVPGGQHEKPLQNSHSPTLHPHPLAHSAGEATIRRMGGQAGRPASMILPDKSSAMISSKAFSPMKDPSRHKASQPVRVDRSVSQPQGAMMHTMPPPKTVPTAASALTTDYPRMRAASSMTNLPTEAGPRTDARGTREMLESWKKSKVGTERGSSSQLSGSSLALNSSARPQAVVELPGHSTPVLPPKNKGRQYMSSPNIMQEANTEPPVKMLTAEIQRLKSEKQALIRHLFHSQGQNYSGAENSALV